jgi:Protein of unknown function (DUF3551)
MRGLMLAAALAVGAWVATGPAEAQTFAPGYPVCLHVYGPATYYECRYTSLEQCATSASGRSAQCVVSPYAANAEMAPTYRRHRHVY